MLNTAVPLSPQQESEFFFSKSCVLSLLMHEVKYEELYKLGAICKINIHLSQKDKSVQLQAWTRR